jgi:3-keto-5-aminohexanoate cleavage enzyme
VREPDGTPSASERYFKETVSQLRAESDVITMVSTGGSVDMTIDERMAGLAAHPDLSGIETGSLNFGDGLFITSRSDTLRVAEAARARSIPLEVEAFEVGHVNQAVRMIRAGEIDMPLRVNLVFGVPGGIDASTDSLYAMQRALPPGTRWCVTAIGRSQKRILALALLHGATSIRVGFEDNIYLSKGQLATSNADLVTQAVGLAHSLGRDVATPAQAREILDLPRLER